MPVAVIPVFTNIWQGPAKVFLNVDLPADGARMVVVNGLPDQTAGANPNAVWLGQTKAGLKFVASQEIASFQNDESPINFRNTPTTELCQLEGEFAELLDFARLILLLPNAVRATGAGYDQIKAGGLATFTTMPIAVIGALIADPTKYAILQLYSAYSAGGLSLNIERKAPNYSPFKFMGQGASSRTAGDQLWTFWKQTV